MVQISALTEDLQNGGFASLKIIGEFNERMPIDFANCLKDADFPQGISMNVSIGGELTTVVNYIKSENFAIFVDLPIEPFEYNGISIIGLCGIRKIYGPDGKYVETENYTTEQYIEMLDYAKSILSEDFVRRVEESVASASTASLMDVMNEDTWMEANFWISTMKTQVMRIALEASRERVEETCDKMGLGEAFRSYLSPKTDDTCIFTDKGAKALN